MNQPAVVHSDAGQASESATDVSHSPGVQPILQSPADPPVTAWQSAEVPSNPTDNGDGDE